ncbi:hypothetical protein HPB47_005668 [Ixodes persulcatus]|uniref:Uncharacterized protein n=1 Tax=Ixodes persulcatus TaxID=34615 RepID=A0AC60PCE7_IXOPE|nr:hypothetical protein HPB47_005668 [Ixodes persulcatus]
MTVYNGPSCRCWRRLGRLPRCRFFLHLLKNKILQAPSPSALQKCVKDYKSEFGFNTNTFEALEEKTTEKDEMKLSENISVQACGRLQGFVDIGKFSAIETNTTPADHGMVILFQPFAENMFLKTGFNASYGRQCKKPIAAAYKTDSHVLPVRVMSRVAYSTLYPNAFERMWVNIAFRLFSDEVLGGLDLHHKTVELNCGSQSATVKFVCFINKLIQVMTSRCPDDALRPQTPDTTFIDDFVNFLTDREEKAKDDGFVSKTTAEGLRVTLESTKGIITYLGHFEYEFLVTARLSQNCKVRLFGIIRQSNEANDHPTPTQVLLTVNYLSFYNLARSPSGGTVSEGVLNSLLGPSDVSRGNALNDLLDAGRIDEVEQTLSSDHSACFAKQSDSRLLYYVAGYVSRRSVLHLKCGDCKAFYLTNASTAPENAACTKVVSRGGLLFVSERMFMLIDHLEKAFMNCFNPSKLHSESIRDVLSCVNSGCLSVGCKTHKHDFTQTVIKF